MDKLINKIFFFLLAPIYGPLVLFSHLTYPWWQEQKKGNFWRKVLFFILLPVYAPIAIFLKISYEWWADMGKH